VSWNEVAAGMCVGLYIFNEKNETTKYAKRFWVRRLPKDGVQHGKTRLCELNVEDGSGFSYFVRMTSSDFEKLLRKVGSRIRRKDTTFRKGISASVRLAVTFRYLACGDFFSTSLLLI
jgi:hypothetical protein